MNSRRAVLARLGLLLSAATAGSASRALAAPSALTGVESRALTFFRKGYPNLIHDLTTESDGICKFVRVGEGRVKVPFEDGKSGKSFEQLLESPDLAESVADPYPLDLDRTKWPVNFDPGRIRVDDFFKAIYGGSEEAVRANLVTVDFCGHRVPFNRCNGAAEALGRVGRKLEALVAADPTLKPHVETLGGTFAWRKIEGTSRLSAHSFAVSIDLNPKLGAYWRWSQGAALEDMKQRKDYPAQIVRAFESERFIWGGKWYHFDLMHFEYRPEYFG
ncbi:MAG: D-alanyl-D-alanine carboxypeptidase [Verrucomicrobia bacterium]|nr:MAG: D-alanyl-D-alanine carboxypeptidase [Verrucomicrobiota bacterium]